MKNILLLIHQDAGQEARLQAALDLVRALDGHLICLDVAAMPQLVGTVYEPSATWLAFADEATRELANRERIELRLAGEGVTWTWIDVTGRLAGKLSEHGKLSDVIVVNRRFDRTDGPDMLTIASEVVVGSGRTVVAVPEDGRGFSAGGRALVAYDGSTEAANAVRSAVPLLALAKEVVLLEAGGASVESPVDDAAEYLARHGIKATVVRRESLPAPIAKALIREAVARGADYIVMGGFGQARLVEAVFGGVSRTMLSESPIPIVMTH